MGSKKAISTTKNPNAISLIYLTTQKQTFARQKNKPQAMPKENWAEYLQYMSRLNDLLLNIKPFKTLKGKDQNLLIK